MFRELIDRFNNLIQSKIYVVLESIGLVTMHFKSKCGGLELNTNHDRFHKMILMHCICLLPHAHMPMHKWFKVRQRAHNMHFHASWFHSTLFWHWFFVASKEHGIRENVTWQVNMSYVLFSWMQERLAWIGLLRHMCPSSSHQVQIDLRRGGIT